MRNYLISQYIFQSGFYLKFECYRLFIDLQGPLLGVAERSWSLHSGLWFDSWPREYFKTAEKQPCPSIYFRWRFILNSNGKSCPVTSRDLQGPLLGVAERSWSVHSEIHEKYLVKQQLEQSQLSVG